MAPEVIFSPWGKFAHALLLVGYLVTSASGLLLLKAAGPVLSPRLVAGAGLYSVGFVIWYVILQKMPLSVAFPLAAGGLIIATQLCGVMFLNETFSYLQLFGAGLILAGIAIIFQVGA